MKNPMSYVAAIVVVLSAVLIMFGQGNTSVAKEEASYDKGEIEKIVREFLLENPDVVVEAIQNYQLKERERQELAFADELKNSAGELYGDAESPFAGNPDGDVTVVEFFDYNCGYCKKAAQDVIKLIETDKNVKVVFKEFPILSESSRDAARWALAANKQGKYFDYHLALMTATGPKNEATLERLAEKVGLDVKQMKKDADSKEVRAQLEKTQALARKLGISGTPAFIIGDKLSPGYIRHDVMQKAVEDVRAGNEG